MNKNFFKKELPIIIYIFLLLFAPPIIKHLNILLICFVFSFLAILFKYRSEVKEILVYKNIKKILKLLVFYYLWYLFTIFFNFIFTRQLYVYNYFINTYSICLVFPILFICCLHIILYCNKNQIPLKKIIEYIIISGLIQSGISILSFLVPSVKSFLLEIMYNNTGEKLYVNSYHTIRRFYGFANNMLDSFGYGTGLLALIPLFYSFKNGKKWLISVPFLLIVPCLNSRTGLVIFFIGFFVWFIFLIKNNYLKNYKKNLILFFVTILVLLFIIYQIKPIVLQWIIDDFSSFFTDKKGTADTLLSQHFWKLPNFFNCIFGTGYNVAAFGGMRNVLGFDSDVGYINEIWKTGIIGLIIIMYFFINLVKILMNDLEKENKFLIISIFITTLVANIKFYVFSYNPGICILILISFVFLLKQRSEDQKLEKEELISVIVPIYNVENELDRCLDSIINQTYQNLEIILVNDGSTDNSKSICDEYLKKDNRIIYIEQKNQGLSAARNTGILKAKGDYYIFIDSDDYINLNFVLELYKTLITNKSDISVCGYKKVYEEKEDISRKENGVICSYSGNLKYYNVYNEFDIYTTVAWNKLYKKEIFKDLKYPISKIHEDEFVVLQVLENANKISYTSCKYYYYYQRANSITGNYKYNRVDILEALKNKMDFFEKKKFKRLYSYALYDYYYQLYNQVKLLKEYCPDKKKKISQIETKIMMYQKEFLLNIYINPLKKIKILLMKFKIIN